LKFIEHVDKNFCDNHGLKNCICRLPIVENDCVLVVSFYLCGKVIDPDVNMWKVTTFEIQQTVEHACVARGHDDWAMAVLGRILMHSDLVAADSIYHLTCDTRFCDALTRTPNKSPTR